MVSSFLLQHLQVRTFDLYIIGNIGTIDILAIEWLYINNIVWLSFLSHICYWYIGTYSQLWNFGISMYCPCCHGQWFSTLSQLELKRTNMGTHVKIDNCGESTLRFFFPIMQENSFFDAHFIFLLFGKYCYSISIDSTFIYIFWTKENQCGIHPVPKAMAASVEAKEQAFFSNFQWRLCWFLSPWTSSIYGVS